MESNGNKLVANRMKKRGMSWTIRGAQHLAKVLQLTANGEWATLCRDGWRSEDTGFKVPRRLARSPTLKSANGQWRQATVPALMGLHAACPWAQALSALAYGNHPLN